MQVKISEALFFGLLVSLIGAIFMYFTKKIYKIKKCCNAECPDLDKHYLFRRMIALFLTGFFCYIFYAEIKTLE